MRSFLILLLMTVPAFAHFPFAVPQKDGTLKVVFSETLDVDEAVTVEKLAKLELTIRGADGKDATIALKAKDHELTAKPEGKPRVAFGTVDYGVMKRDKAFLLRYHVKTVWPGHDAQPLGKTQALEIVPLRENGKVVLLALAAGEPVANAEINLIKPEGKEKLKTDAKGRTEPQALTGQYGAWVRNAEAKAGEFEKEKYDEIRHYATLVVAP